MDTVTRACDGVDVESCTPLNVMCVGVLGCLLLWWKLKI